MLEYFTWTSTLGQSFTFNTALIPLKEFTVEGEIRSEEIDRMQEHGIWPAYSYSGKMLIHINGDILCNTAAEYIQQRMLMMQALVPAGVVVNTRKMGDISMQYTGMEPMITEPLTGACLDSYPQIPMRALYPSVTEFDITFKVFRGYMVGAGSGKPYSI